MNFKDLVNEGDAPKTEKFLENTLTQLEKAHDAAGKELREGSRLQRALMKIYAEIEEEIMFVQKGEYN